MLSLQQTLQLQAKSAAAKVTALKKPLAFTVSGLFGGAYIGIGVVLMISAAGPMVATGDPFAKLISGLVFGAALVLVVFAGAELITSTMMTITQGVAMKSVALGPATAVFLVTFVANFIGAFIFSILVAVSGVLTVNKAAWDMLSGLLLVKADSSVLELFMRGILCNLLVTLAVWMSLRIKENGAKIAVILLAILAFVASGFEHVVANMTVYWLGVFGGDPNASGILFATNMLWVGLGNLVGGGFFVGLAYWLIGERPKVKELDTVEKH